MNVFTEKLNLIEEVVKLSRDAGESILAIYNDSNLDFNFKEDNTPLTSADIASNNVIVKGLKKITPELPILSEEGSDIPYSIRSKWDQYWLIDPLDGTKEFLKRNGEFTVNIALIKNGRPILGVIYVPVNNEIFYGYKDGGSFYEKGKNSAKKIEVANDYQGPIRIVSSRSHTNKQLISFIKNIKNKKVLSIGSSLKFCLIASGKADIYPRFGPTSEWDTAAGDAIVKFAGGSIMTEKKEELIYNQKESLLNPNFIAYSNNKYNDMFTRKKETES
tara:strand:- start:10270 stop:11094 length:825 start_codon:yes stop_codon:yes gene_type:complete